MQFCIDALELALASISTPGPFILTGNDCKIDRYFEARRRIRTVIYDFIHECAFFVPMKIFRDAINS